MIDSFIFLAPILLLPVVALLGFVGCNWFWGLDETRPIEAGPAPTGLVATPGNNKVALSWDPYPDAPGFNVKRGEVSGVYTQSFTATMNSYTDSTALNGITYFYVVTALPTETTLESIPSEEVFATPSAVSLVPFLKPTMLGFVAGVPTGFYGFALVVGAAPLTIETLGRIVIMGNSQIHTVKIVDAGGVDIPNAFVSVNLAGGTPGTFVYAPLTPPVTLSALTKYYIVSQEIQGLDQFYNHDSVVQTTDAGTIPSPVRGGPPYVEDSVANRAYGIVNFQY